MPPYPLGRRRTRTPAQRGLYLLVREKQDGKTTRTWLLRYKFAGSGLKSLVLGHSPDTSLDAARGEARRLRELAVKGINPAKARPTRNPQAAPVPLSPVVAGTDVVHSIEFLVSEFITRYLRKEHDCPEYSEGILNRDVLPEWKGRDARTIEPHEVVTLLDKIVDRGSKVMANRTASLLTKLFKFGIQRRIVKAQPVQLLMKPGGKEKKRRRVWSEEEIGAFLTNPKACTRYERLARVLTILLLTGQRRGELAKARWSEIDWDQRTWSIPGNVTQNRRSHVVPLSDWAVREFEGLHRLNKDSQYVFPTKDGTACAEPKQITRGVAKNLKRFAANGIAAFRPHDLRRTCRTGLSRLKVSHDIKERVINHVRGELDEVYDQWEYLEEKRDALNKWAVLLEEIRDAARQGDGKRAA